MYGMPFHSITAHFFEWFRFIPLRSVNSENQERCFKDIKIAEATTNFNQEHMTCNVLIRSQVKRTFIILGYTDVEN